MESKLTKSQTKTFGPRVMNTLGETITATVRYNDDCGNGHNSFAITADIKGKRGQFIAGGCCHDEIASHFPELAHLIKWHLCSSDGPMYYIANTTYHAKAISKHQGQQFVYLGNAQLDIKKTLLGIFSDAELNEIRKQYPAGEITTKEHFNGMAKDIDLDAARSCAVWPDATLEQLQDKSALQARLPALLDAMRADVEAIGFTW